MSDSGPKLSSDNCVMSNLTNPKPEKVSYYIIGTDWIPKIEVRPDGRNSSLYQSHGGTTGTGTGKEGSMKGPT